MKVVSEHTWCLTANGERVPEGHPLARFLLVSKGCEIEESELKAYPILEELEQVESEPEAEDEDEDEERWPDGEPVKRPRGRPRKIPITE